MSSKLGQEAAAQIADANYGPFAGQVIGTMRNLCKRAFLNGDPRIGEGMYVCSMMATATTYGVCYKIIEKCRGKVIKEEIQEGTNDFALDALIPLVEGFKFSDSIRTAT